MKKSLLLSAALVLALLTTLLHVAGTEQLHLNVGSAANDGTGDTLRGAFGKVETNFNTLFPSYFATNQSYALQSNITFHAWTGTAVIGANTLPAAGGASPSNIFRLILKDEGGNAGTTNVFYSAVSGEVVDGAAAVALTSDYQVIRLYTTGGTNWFTW